MAASRKAHGPRETVLRRCWEWLEAAVQRADMAAHVAEHAPWLTIGAFSIGALLGYIVLVGAIGFLTVWLLVKLAAWLNL